MRQSKVLALSVFALAALGHAGEKGATEGNIVSAVSVIKWKVEKSVFPSPGRFARDIDEIKQKIKTLDRTDPSFEISKQMLAGVLEGLEAFSNGFSETRIVKLYYKSPSEWLLTQQLEKLPTTLQISVHALGDGHAIISDPGQRSYILTDKIFDTLLTFLPTNIFFLLNKAGEVPENDLSIFNPFLVELKKPFSYKDTDTGFQYELHPSAERHAALKLTKTILGEDESIIVFDALIESSRAKLTQFWPPSKDVSFKEEWSLLSTTQISEQQFRDIVALKIEPLYALKIRTKTVEKDYATAELLSAPKRAN